MKTKEQHEVLLKMRALLERPEAWRQYLHDSPPDLSGRCIMQAVSMCGESTLYGSTADLLRSLIPWRTHIHSMIAWNDAPERTHSDILALLDKALSLPVAAEKGEQA